MAGEIIIPSTEWLASDSLSIAAREKRDLASPLTEFFGVTLVAGILYYGGTLVLNLDSDLKASEFITYIIFSKSHSW